MSDLDKFNPKKNSIIFLKFILATLVILHHSYALGGFKNNLFEKLGITLGTISIDGFFSISGFLVIQSFLNNSLKNYLLRRFLRIFPAFWICLLFTAFIISPIIYFLEHKNIAIPSLLNNSFINYLKSNFLLVINQHKICGVFVNNPFKEVVNGSLWFLFPLFLCYLSLPILEIFKLTTIKKNLLLILFFLIIASYGFQGIAFGYLENFSLEGFSRKLFVMHRFFAFFLSGLLLYLYRAHISFTIAKLIIMLSLLFISIFLKVYTLIGVVLLPYILVALAVKLPITSFNKNIDISYGLYLYAFPIQQAIYLFNHNIKNPIVFFAISLICTLPFAWLNWFFIDKKVKIKTLKFK